MNHLYLKLSITNLKNNRQFYLPYLLAGMVSGMMFYIMRAIQGSEGIENMRGHSVLQMVLTMGLVVVGACSCIFLFYTNSFVMKRRKKELGVYNILGMEKKHIAKVMAWETVILYVISVTGGLVLGIVFHKLAAMFLYKLTGLSQSIPFYISGRGCLQTAELFGLLYLVMLLYNFIQVRLANPIELLHGNHMGEREPKAKWISAVLGIICILTGYYLAVTVYGVIEAVNMFFIAVILVIIGTYELFMTVSIAFLKLLKKNKKYYYKTAHFISVSGMLYRMKRNAVGLANICVLSTMVLVIISTTVCMYTGIEDSLRRQFEKEISAAIDFNSIPDDETRNILWQQVRNAAEKQKWTVSEQTEYVDMVFITHTIGNEVELYNNENAAYDFRDMGMLNVMTKYDYEKNTGESIDTLTPGNVMISSSMKFEQETIKIFGKEYQIAGKMDFNDREEKDLLGDVDLMYLIMADNSELEEIQKIAAASGALAQGQYHIGMEIDGTVEERKACAAAVREMLENCREQMGFEMALVTSRAEQRDEYMALNGGFLFLGLFLGSMFLMITVLIIYYKQISEGYEDRERFAIMTKVGMSRDMVRAAINGQVRTVFFMPITAAFIHLTAAFPMLRVILSVFGLQNIRLFAGCIAATAAVFALIYYIVFRLTSKSYMKIVYC